MKPTKGILDPDFQYTPSHQTDIRKRFERERKRLKQQAPPEPANVVPMQRKDNIK